MSEYVYEYSQSSGYSSLSGPNGFICTLTEPEDRTWSRDLNPVVQELRRIHVENVKLINWSRRAKAYIEENGEHEYDCRAFGGLHKRCTCGLDDFLNDCPSTKGGEDE